MEHQLINSKATHYSGIVYEEKTFNAHFHNSYELIYVIEGQISVIINGQAVILTCEELILISPCVIHEICDCENAKYFIAIITPDYIADFFAAKRNEVAIRFRIDSDARTLIKKKLIEAKELPKYQLKACFYMLLSFTENGTAVLPSDNWDVQFVYTINAYISEHFTEKILRKDLAQIMGYEEHYFSQLFRQNFGIGIRRYLNIHRISYACQLLLNTNRNVSHIAYDSGFTCVREFNNVFSQLLKQTPTEYRNKFFQKTIAK